MNQIRYLILSLSLLPLLFVASAEAQGANKGKGEQVQNKGRKRGAWMDELGLSEEQTKQIRALRKDSRKSQRQKRRQIRAMKKELRQMMRTEASDAELRKKFDEIEKLKLERSKNRFEQTLAIRKILTEEQRKKFRGFLREKRMRGHHRGAKGFMKSRWRPDSGDNEDEK